MKTRFFMWWGDERVDHVSNIAHKEKDKNVNKRMGKSKNINTR